LVVTFNYFILRHNFNGIRQIAEHHGNTRVIREGKILEIQSSDIVVGDLFYLDT
jgi:magnesium-transporting ATPase (P-type)